MDGKYATYLGIIPMTDGTCVNCPVGCETCEVNFDLMGMGEFGGDVVQCTHCSSNYRHDTTEIEFVEN